MSKRRGRRGGARERRRREAAAAKAVAGVAPSPRTRHAAPVAPAPGGRDGAAPERRSRRKPPMRPAAKAVSEPKPAAKPAAAPRPVPGPRPAPGTRPGRARAKRAPVAPRAAPAGRPAPRRGRKVEPPRSAGEVSRAIRAAAPTAPPRPSRRAAVPEPEPTPAARPMRIVTTIEQVRDAVSLWRSNAKEVHFVPTMGAIHAGHESLVSAAAGRGRRVVASIFVNPLQFGAGEDFERYPRPVEQDRRRLAAAGADLVWEPRREELYPQGHRTRVRVEGLADVLEGASRPGHFDGVCTVVACLLGVVQPDVLWLGQKDAQQARILEQMCRDLHLPLEVRRAPIVREKDGLALSSRNAYLDAEERREAAVLNRGLEAARAALDRGERSAGAIAAAVRAAWKRARRVKEDYVAVVDADTLQPVDVVKRGRRVLVAVAARVGPARLIDNFEWESR